jgi:hypothetical protein
LNATDTDETTDAWDTIDWLVKHVPQSNGKVGMFGTSSDGFTVVMALLHPHPALKAAVPESPKVDNWMGDDWYHYGAFRQPYLDFFAFMTGYRGAGALFVPRAAYDDYEEFLNAGSPGTDTVGKRFVEPGNHVGRDSRVAGAQIGRTRIEQLVGARPLVCFSGEWRRLEPRGLQVARRYLRRVPEFHGNAVLQSILEERSAGTSRAGHDLQSGGKTLAALRHLAECLRAWLHVSVKSALLAG